MTADIMQRLILLADESSRACTERTMPNVATENIIGVRVPELRKIAKDITKSDWRGFLLSEQGGTIEEHMLRGFVIATATMSDEERFEHIREFVPSIDNWGVCDTFCVSFKLKKQSKPAYWEFIRPYFYSEKEYDVRFALVMMLAHFHSEEYADEAFDIIESVKLPYYYVKMAAAWAISVYFVNCPEKTMCFLQNNELDDFTFNKALQKITESYRVDGETKKVIRAMKRSSASISAQQNCNKTLL